MKNNLELEALANALTEKLRQERPVSRPALRLVPKPPPQLFDSITRDSCRRRVRFLAKAYRLQWLVEQHTFNVGGLDSLEDAALGRLLEDAERARECVAEGVSFEDAGLIRNTAALLPDQLDH